MTMRNYFSLFHDLKGMQHIVQIFFGTYALWFLSRILGNIDPLWAIISLILVTETNMQTTWLSFKTRIINTIIGCLTGLLFLLFITNGSLMLPLALATAIFVSVYVVRMSYGWRVAAITAAIIVIPALTEGSQTIGMAVEFQRTMEVFLGSMMAVFITWCFNTIKSLNK